MKHEEVKETQKGEEKEKRKKKQIPGTSYETNKTKKRENNATVGVYLTRRPDTAVHAVF